MEKKVTVCVIVSINTLGGTGHYEDEVDFQTALLMMNSDVVTIRERSYRVKYKEVDSRGNVNFYSVEIKRDDSDILKTSDIEKY